MELSFCELRCKQVVNLFDGKNLGNVIDLTFDVNTTKVTGIVVPCDKSFFNIFKSNNDIFIPFHKICKIGKDIILVELTPVNTALNNDKSKIQSTTFSNTKENNQSKNQSKPNMYNDENIVVSDDYFLDNYQDINKNHKKSRKNKQNNFYDNYSYYK